MIQPSLPPSLVSAGLRRKLLIYLHLEVKSDGSSCPAFSRMVAVGYFQPTPLLRDSESHFLTLLGYCQHKSESTNQVSPFIYTYLV